MRKHRWDRNEPDRCVCGGMVTWFEPLRDSDTVDPATGLAKGWGEGCEVENKPWPLKVASLRHRQHMERV